MKEKKELIEPEKLEKDLKRSKGDSVHTIARTLMELVPIAGGSAAELFSEIITPPINKRRDKWLILIAEAIRELQNEFNEYNMDNLSKNEIFITTVMHATMIAIRNHKEEKIEALKNAVLNSALNNSPEEDLELIFLNYIDTFTVLHLRLLEFFNKTLTKELINELAANCKLIERTEDTIVFNNLGEVLEYIFPDLKGQDFIYENVVRDLNTKGLIIVMAPADPMLEIRIKDDNMVDPQVQSIGKMFLSYISPPK